MKEGYDVIVIDNLSTGRIENIASMQDNKHSKFVKGSITDLSLLKSPYAVSKLAGEFYCQVFSEVYGLKTVCLRYFNVYGPKQDPSSEYAAVIPRFIIRMLNNQPPIIYGDGTQTRDFTYVKDVVYEEPRP